MRNVAATRAPVNPTAWLKAFAISSPSDCGRLGPASISFIIRCPVEPEEKGIFAAPDHPV